MPLLQQTKDFLAFLQQRRDVRDRIKAGRDKTLLYAGDMRAQYWGITFTPAWHDIQAIQRKQPGTVEILPDVLAKLPAPPPHGGTLKTYVAALAEKEKTEENKRVVWRALSGIFASNAEGKVWFYVGSNVSHDTKVFALTEIAVLKRNPRVSVVSQQMLAYYERCVRTKNPNMAFGYLPGAD